MDELKIEQVKAELQEFELSVAHEEETRKASGGNRGPREPYLRHLSAAENLEQLEREHTFQYPDLARLCISLHERLAAAEAREKVLVTAMRRAMGGLNELERMAPFTELPTELWLGLELAIRGPVPLSAPLFEEVPQ